jgi:hypothetical protein
MRFSTDSIRIGSIGVVTFNHRLTDATISAITNPNHNIDLTESPDIRFIFEDTIELYAMRDTLNILIEFIERNYDNRIKENRNEIDRRR